MMVAKVFQTTLANVPAKVPYLAADAELSGQWKERLPSDGRRKVGLVWAARIIPDPQRSATLKHFAPLAKVPNTAFVSLQIGACAAQAATDGAELNLIDVSSQIKDFADTAALIDNLDVVITVDTAVAHLAGAMGKPTWVLIRSVPDWRWMLDRSDCPWYPTMRLFRQPSVGDWTTPVEQVVEALAG
jgi:ADP-heptose:LPS heptosyltransferase